MKGVYDMEQVLARGVNFLYTKQFIVNKYGNERWEGMLQSLSDDSHKIWNGSLVPIGEYPFSSFKELTSILSSELKLDHESELASIYEYISDHSLNSLYKIFFSFANPSFVIKNYPKLWRRFFNSGIVEVPVSESGHAILKFTLPEIFFDWLEPACLGYSKKAVEMAGGRNLTMEIKDTSKISNDLWEIVYELHWFE
jgi:hypothetical protein